MFLVGTTFPGADGISVGRNGVCQRQRRCCCDATVRVVALSTKLVADGGGLGGVRRLADTGGVAAADAEAVGLPLGEVEQSKPRRFNGDLGVDPLPAVCA